MRFTESSPRALSLSGAALPTLKDQQTPLLTPVCLRGREAIGELFEYRLELKTADVPFYQLPNDSAAGLDLDSLIGQEVTIGIELEGKRGTYQPDGSPLGSGTREITGIICEAALLREEGRSWVYEITLRPWCHALTLNSDCRIFQNLTVEEITDAVFARYLYSYDKRFARPYPLKHWPQRDIQRQHWESDWNFLTRLWQEWGIFWYFEHSNGHHRLVLCNHHGNLNRHGPACEAIRFAAPGGQRIDEEHIYGLTLASRMTTGAHTSRDYDYTRTGNHFPHTSEDPRHIDTSNAQTIRASRNGLSWQERYTWGDYAQPKAGAAGISGEPSDTATEAHYLTWVQIQAERIQGQFATGESNVRGLTCGQYFELTDHPAPHANIEWTVHACDMEIEDIGEHTGAAQTWRCTNRFTLRPAKQPFYLRRSIPKPQAGGTEYAVVTTPNDQEIWPDALGRIKIRFLWDRISESDHQSSCWVRVAGHWHGRQWGGTFIPRQGQEVVVAFVNGDPDLPIIVGSVANTSHHPAWELPGNHALAGYRSKELGTTRANSLVFDDTKGQIQTQLASDEGASQLSLGYITRITGHAGRKDERGVGAELRTDGHGVFRAAKGLLLTTEPRANAQAHITDLDETASRLEDAEHWQNRLAEAAQQAAVQDVNEHQAAVAQALKKQNDAIRGAASSGQPGDFPELSAPHLVLAGAAGIESTTPASTHIASGQHIALSSGDHIAVSANDSVFVTAENTIRMLAVRGDIKAASAEGDIDIHALKKAINLLALLEVNVTSETIQITAKKKLILNGGGSYIELDNAGLKTATNGIWVAHGSRHAFVGPHQIPAELKAPTVCLECLLKAAQSGSSVIPRL